MRSRGWGVAIGPVELVQVDVLSLKSAEEASHAIFTDSASRRQSACSLGGSKRLPPVSERGLKPDTLVARTTRERHSGFLASHVPMYSSVLPGLHPGALEGTGYISAVSMKFTPRSLMA